MNALIIISIVVALASLVGLSVVWQRSNDKINMADLKTFQADNRVKDMEAKMKSVIEGLEGEIQKQIFGKIEELDQTAIWLNEQITIVSMQKRMAEKQFTEGVSRVNWANNENFRLQAIKADAEKLLANSRKELYEVRESTLFVYNHYKVLTDVLNKIVMGEADFEQTVSLLSTANSNLLVTRDNFVRHFRKTPEEYVNLRDNISGKNADGSQFLSKFSKN